MKTMIITRTISAIGLGQIIISRKIKKVIWFRDHLEADDKDKPNK